MISFMVIAAPRSGTAWAANWLTNGLNHCIHDPLWDYHYAELDKIEMPGKMIGVACTGMALWPDWINRHPAPKVILHRPQNQVNESARRLGFPPCPSGIFKGLDLIRGFHVEWESLFHRDHARDIYEHLLLPEPFDEQRHEMLCTLNVTSNIEARRQNPRVFDKLRAEGIPAIDDATPDQRPLQPAAGPADAAGHKDPD